MIVVSKSRLVCNIHVGDRPSGNASDMTIRTILEHSDDRNRVDRTEVYSYPDDHKKLCEPSYENNAFLDDGDDQKSIRAFITRFSQNSLHLCTQRRSRPNSQSARELLHNFSFRGSLISVIESSFSFFFTS